MQRLVVAQDWTGNPTLMVRPEAVRQMGGQHEGDLEGDLWVAVVRLPEVLAEPVMERMAKLWV